MPVELVTRRVIHQDGVDVLIPPNCFVTRLGVEYIRVSTTSRPIISAIFPGRVLGKNVSIAASSVMTRLLKERKVSMGLDEVDTSTAQQLFDGGNDEPEVATKPKKKTPSTEPCFVSSDGIHIMGYTGGRDATLCIKYAADDLDKFFQAMRAAEDEDQCLGGKHKRPYQKTGQYKGITLKRARGSTEAPPVDGDA